MTYANSTKRSVSRFFTSVCSAPCMKKKVRRKSEEKKLEPGLPPASLHPVFTKKTAAAGLTRAPRLRVLYASKRKRGH
jgi:hypothetical protein